MYINRKKNKLKIESVPTVLMTEKQVISTVLAARLICGIKLRCFFFFFKDIIGNIMPTYIKENFYHSK